MIVSINQPMFIPWLGYYHRIALANVHVYLDAVQFEKGSLINRNFINFNQQKVLLTIPIKKRTISSKINEIIISNTKNWINKHLRTIEQAYKKSKYFIPIFSEIEKIYNFPHDSICEKLFSFDNFIINYLNINTKLIKMSENTFSRTKSNLILDICLKFKAQSYLSGTQGYKYLNIDDFKKHSIEIIYYDYKKIMQNSKFDLNNFSVLDFLFKYGTESKHIFRDIKFNNE